VINILNGNVPIERERVEKFEKEMRRLRLKSISTTLRRKILRSSGGLQLLSAIQDPVCDYLNAKHNNG